MVQDSKPLKFAVLDAYGNQKQTTLLQAAMEEDYKSLKVILNNFPMVIDMTFEGVGTLLHYAVKEGNITLVQFLLEYEACTDSFFGCGKTPLHLAIQSKRMDLVKLLLDHDAVIFNSYGHSAIEMAVKNRDFDLLKLMFQKHPGCLPNHKDENDDFSSFHKAVYQGDLELVKFLLGPNTRLDISNNEKMTPLHHAAQFGHLDILKILLENEADVNAQDNKQWTPLHHAAKSGHYEVVIELLNAGANTEVQDMDMATALHLAAGFKNIAMLLLENNANIKALDGKDQTVLHYAAMRGELDLIKHFLELDASLLEMKSKDGLYAFHFAIKHGNVKLFQFLFDKHSNILDDNLLDELLPFAIKTGKMDVVKMITDKSKSGSDLFPLHCAAKLGNMEMVKTLVDNGYEVQQKNKENKTPLDIAIENTNGIVVMFLKTKVAQILPENATLVNRTEIPNTCEICIGSRDGVYAFVPCGHSLACETCCLKILGKEPKQAKCPYCRRKANGYMKIFVL